jgi:hypothetical protein
MPKNMRHSTILPLYIKCLNQEPKLEIPDNEICKYGVRSANNSMNNGMRLTRNIMIGNTAWMWQVADEDHFKTCLI